MFQSSARQLTALELSLGVFFSGLCGKGVLSRLYSVHGSPAEQPSCGKANFLVTPTKKAATCSLRLPFHTLGFPGFHNDHLTCCLSRRETDNVRRAWGNTYTEE